MNNNLQKISEREMTWEERVQWVMKYTDVEWENLYITEEVLNRFEKAFLEKNSK